MATLEERNGWFRIVYRFNGVKRTKSLKTRDQTEANFVLAKLEQVLKNIVHGQLDPPKSGVPTTGFFYAPFCMSVLPGHDTDDS